MSSGEAVSDFPDESQRMAFCQSQWSRRTSDGMYVSDRAGYEITHREYTPEGYLRVPAHVARCGIQQYLAKEIAPPPEQEDPLDLRNRTGEVINVYRPPEEVFDPQSLASYADSDITDGHPAQMVDAGSYKDVSLGHATDGGQQDGEYVRVPLLIKDGEAIRRVEQGRSMLSAGYWSKYDWTPGTAPDGTPYEAVQRGILINHIALVDRPRAGAGARLFDHDTTSGGKTMATVTLDGKSVDMPDQPTAQLVQSAFDAEKSKYDQMAEKAKEYEDEAAKLRDEMEKMKAEKDKAMEEKDEALKAASDEAIAERLKVIADTKDAAVKVAGQGFTSDSLDAMTVKREALAKARPSIDWAAAEDAYVSAAWDMAVADAEADPAKASHDSLGRDAAHAAHSTQTADDSGYRAYDAFLRGEDPTEVK
jgi:hypothetical protein